MHKLTIGRRLTLWYGGILAIGLLAFAGVVFSSFARNLVAEIDRALAEELIEIAAVVRLAPDRANLVTQLERDFGSQEFYEIQVSDMDGAVVFHTPALAERTLPVPVDPQTKQSTADAEVAGMGPFRVATRLGAGPSGEYVIQAADSLQLFQRELTELLAVMLSAGPIVLGIGLAGGHWLSQRALAPVDRLTKTAIEVSASRLDRRVAVANPDDELGRLAQAFNGMIERLERSFDEMRRFTADAAHELRTPLAILRSEAEVTLRAERPSSQYRHALENQLEEIARLTRLTDELLFLCREDAGLQAPLRPVRIDVLLEQLVGQLQTAAQARDVTLVLETAAPCTIASDPDRLRRLFFNLLDNALKYTSALGSVRIRCVRSANAAVEVTVIDTGIGIPAEHLSHVCRRFYRVDPARGRSIEGTGLGLSICQAIVEAHHGALRFENAPGGGTRVTAALPLAESDSVAGGFDPFQRGAPPTVNTNISGSDSAPGDGVWVATQRYPTGDNSVVIPAP